VTANRGHHPTTSTSSFLTSNQPNGERKEETTTYEGKHHRDDGAQQTAPATTTTSDTEEVVMTAALLRIVKHGYSLSWFKQRVFPYLGPNVKDTIELRRFCRLFRDSLDAPLWTSFPNSKYKSLHDFMKKLNSVYKKDPTKAPTIVIIMEGTFHGNGAHVNINYPLMMIGAGRNKTFLGGYQLRIGGTKEEGKEVVVQDMTSSFAATYGLSAGLPFLCKDMTFTQCGWSGVAAENTKGRLINCVITQCRRSGIHCEGKALIEVEGDQTKVDGNVTSGNSWHYGLNTSNTSSIIYLLFPLTKESVSTNNQGGGDYNSDGGTIETVHTLAC
jgi:hypothetical protein